jgi:hypothetical protein
MKNTMKGLARGLLALTTMLAMANCAGITVESTWKSNGVSTASFDLQCPVEKVDIVVLKRNDGLGCLGSRVGARGCGKQTQYECDNARNWHRSAEISSVDSK